MLHPKVMEHFMKIKDELVSVDKHNRRREQLKVLKVKNDELRNVISDEYSFVDLETKGIAIEVLEITVHLEDIIGKPDYSSKHDHGCTGSHDHSKWHRKEIYEEIRRRTYLKKNQTRTGRARADKICEGSENGTDAVHKVNLCPVFVREVLKQETQDVREAMAKYDMSDEFREMYLKIGFEWGYKIGRLDEKASRPYNDEPR